MLSGSASLALHGAVLVLAVALVGKHASEPARPPIVVTPVEVVAAVAGPPATPPRGTSVTAPPTPVVRTVARAARPQVQRAQPSAATAERSLADLTIRYDDSSNFADRGPRTVESAGDGPPRGIAAGIAHKNGGSVATVDIPQPPVVSLARAARAKYDYSRLLLPNASRFAGQRIKLLLTIDAKGRVRSAQLVHGVDRELDRRSITLASTFEFEPALDDDGVAVQGRCALDMDIVEDEDNLPFETARERAGH